MSEVDRHLLVILGGTGDLASRKLIPSMYRLINENDIGDRCIILGAATTNLDDHGYRKWARRVLRDAGLSEDELTAWCDQNVFYQPLNANRDAYPDLRRRIDTLERSLGLPGNRVFYLALPPVVFPVAIDGLGEAGLNSSPGGTRLVIEKPIGTDLESARALNRVVHTHFEESQVYRIDHYGKETVQNLLNFRFANPMFESLWNRDRIEFVDIHRRRDRRRRLSGRVLRKRWSATGHGAEPPHPAVGSDRHGTAQRLRCRADS